MRLVCDVQLTEITFAFHMVVQQHYSGDMNEFIILKREILWGYFAPKIIEIQSVFNELFKI